jgi:hypothetical protein
LHHTCIGWMEFVGFAAATLCHYNIVLFCHHYLLAILTC